MTENIIAITTDAKLLPAAFWAAQRIQAMIDRPDVTVALVSDSFEELRKAVPIAGGVDLRHFQASQSMPDAGSAPRLTGAAYFRMFLPRVLAPAKRIIYLDVDTYPESADLVRLFDLDMKGHAIAAVFDYGLHDPAGTEHYLNSGVLLIDCGAYLAADIERRWWAASRGNGADDQVALNLVLEGNWLELSPAFNMTSFGLLSEISEIFRPVVTHFMGPVKPWSGPRFQYDHPARAELEHFIPSSPWPDFLPRFFNFADAWTASHATRVEPRIEAIFPPGFAATARRYVQDTRFADVEQGITGRLRKRASVRTA